MTVYTEEMREAGKLAPELDEWPVNPREEVI